jgi:hypothetical protein
VTWSVPEADPPAKTDDGVPLAQAIEERESVWAALVLLAALAGLVCGVLGIRGEAIATAVAVLGVVAMAAVSAEPLGPEVEYELGFGLVSIGFALLVLWHSGVAVEQRVRARREARLDLDRISTAAADTPPDSPA